MKKISHLLIFLSFLIVGCEDDSSTRVELSAKILKDVAYGSHDQQIFDIYLPKGRTSEKTKVLVFIHGGGWESGDKVDLDGFIDVIKEKIPQYAIINMNYRLASPGNSPFPMQIDDIQLLLDYIDVNQNELQIKNEYAFTGISAGAHLALLYTYSKDQAKLIKSVTSIVGPTDLTDPAYTNPTVLTFAFLFKAIENLTGVTFSSNPSYYADVSPLYHVNASSAPTQLFYGGIDPLIPKSQGENLHLKLNELSVPNEFIFYPNEGHGWNGSNLEDTISKLEEFINNYLN